jgi:hypothetical protein
MPNWCSNTITLKGEQKEIERFDKKFKGEDGIHSFKNFIPIPEGLAKEKHHMWRIYNWGTKWDLGDWFSHEIGEGEAYYFFNTAWSPCIEVVEKMSADFPKLKIEFEYEEDGVKIAGKICFKNGEIEEEDFFEPGGVIEYRVFKKEHLDSEYETCSNCGALLEEYEYEDECYECGLTLEERERKIVLKETFERRLNVGKKELNVDDR